MTKGSKLFISILALLFSLSAAALGISLTDELPVLQHAGYNFVFTAQFVLTFLTVFAVFLKTKEKEKKDSGK